MTPPRLCAILPRMRLLVPLLLLLAACAPATQPAQPEATPPAAQEQEANLWPPDTHVVLEGEEALALANQCSRVSPGPVTGQWVPSEGEIEAMESALILQVAQHMEQAGLEPTPGDYHRQYAGFIIDGRNIIYANGVDEDAIRRDVREDFDWRTQAIRICDGGTITFGVEYDPATRQFANFAFNGSRAQSVR